MPRYYAVVVSVTAEPTIKISDFVFLYMIFTNVALIREFHICANKMRVLYISILIRTIAHLPNILPINHIKKAFEPRPLPGNVPSPNEVFR